MNKKPYEIDPEDFYPALVLKKRYNEMLEVYRGMPVIMDADDQSKKANIIIRNRMLDIESVINKLEK